jgi:NADPH-dependent ferric siderophore reductase
VTRPFPLHTGVAEVTARAPVTPSMARFTLAAPEFADFGVEQPGEIITLGWGDHQRNYTVRHYRPERAEVDVDFFLHGDAGRAAAWGERAQPGDRVGFAGPRTHWSGVNGAAWSLLAADETGVPAALAILETLPATHRTIAVLECAEPQTAAAGDVRWVDPGTLADAVRAIEVPGGPGIVWGGGESSAMTKIRRHAKRRPDVTVDVLGYWKLESR